MNRKFAQAGLSHKKLDSIALTCGREKYTDDFVTDNPLYVSFLY